MVNSVESKLGVINSFIESSKRLIGDFKGVQVTVKNSDMYFSDINDQVSSMKELMEDNYHSIKHDLNNRSITGSPEKLRELSTKLDELQAKIHRMDEVISKAELSKAKVSGLEKTIKANANELEGLWKKEKKMGYRLTKLVAEEEEATSGSFLNRIKKSFNESSPFVKSDLKVLRRDIEAHRHAIHDAHAREEEIEIEEMQLSREIYSEINEFKTMLDG